MQRQNSVLIARDLEEAHVSTPPSLQPIGVVLGSDSLTTHRSGIGRVTFELGCELRQIASVTSLRLWMGQQLHGPELLEHVEERADLPATSTEAPRKRFRLLVARVPGVQTLRLRMAHRRLAGEFAALKEFAGGRLVYHEPNMITKPFDGVTVVQINDLSWLHHPEMHPRSRIDWIKRHLDRTLRQASRFVAISEFTAGEFVRELGVAAERVDVVPCAPSRVFALCGAEQAAATLAGLDLRDRGYVLSVSTLEPRKNFDRLVQAHLMLPPALRQRYPLVIAGAAGWGTTLQNSAAEAARREGTLRLLGRLPDSVLAEVTARAAAVAYVSLYEGFGLPVLEAMAAGTPVVASSTTAVCETAGGAARLVDPMNVDAIAGGLREVLEDPALAERLTRGGLVRAREFTWRRTAEGLLGSWQTALG